MKTVHYYPSPKPNGEYSNPYSMHYRDALGKYFKVVDTQLWKGDILPLELVFSALFRGDIYIFNWIENFGYKHLKRLHLFLILLCFKIIKARGKKLVFQSLLPSMGFLDVMIPIFSCITTISFIALTLTSSSFDFPLLSFLGNCSVNSVIVGSKRLCNFAARPIAH